MAFNHPCCAIVGATSKKNKQIYKYSVTKTILIPQNVQVIKIIYTFTEI